MADTWGTQTWHLLISADRRLLSVIGLSLQVSLTATCIAALLGLPLAAILAQGRGRSRAFLVSSANALLGLPPVVVGLALYLFLSRSGPLGDAGLLFTPTAMALAQTILALPIVVAVAHQSLEHAFAQFGGALRVQGAGRIRAILPLLGIGRRAAVVAVLAAFGRTVSEVGAILIVGGNIDGSTRTMTTAIALETSRGDFPLALALGSVLIAISLLVSIAAFSVSPDRSRRP